MKLCRYSRFANVIRSITFRSVMLAPVGDPFHRKNARAHPGKRDYNNRVHTRSLLFFMVLKPLRPNRRIFVRVSSALWRRSGRCDPFLPPRLCSRRAYDLHDNVLRIRSGMEYLPRVERVEKSTCKYLNTYITHRVSSNRYARSLTCETFEILD